MTSLQCISFKEKHLTELENRIYTYHVAFVQLYLRNTEQGVTPKLHASTQKIGPFSVV
jgi:hypothetical protein